MPRYKSVPSLYSIAIKSTCSILIKFCRTLEKLHILNKSTRINCVNEFLCMNIPTSILDDILNYYSISEVNNSMICYYFYKVVLHQNVKKFRAKNLQLSLSYWECLFRTSFRNLIELNLALSCTDEIINLISIYCPNLEYLKATCRYERMRMGPNATAFTLSVTDKGLKHLCDCKKLKVITLNDPRSQRNGTRNSITYAGLRELLINVPTIEDITYTDLGSVISKDMDHIESLNLRILRHFNATECTIKEILRLCKNLRDLYLAFFNIEDNHINIMNLLLNSNLVFYSLGLVNFNFSNQFDNFFIKIGANLIYLSVSNCTKPINFQNLITIGHHCPNLKFLKYNLIDNSADNQTTNRNSLLNLSNLNAYFNKLEDFYISGNELDIENILRLCTYNAKHLENFKLTEFNRVTSIDRILLKSLNNLGLKHIELSAKLIVKDLATIKRIIQKFPYLTYLSVYCADDCKELKMELIQENYDLTFINQKNNFLDE